MKSTRITAGVETQRLAHEQDKHYAERRDKAEEDYKAAVEAMRMLMLANVDLEARRARAREARKRLLSVSWTLARPIGGPSFEELIGVLVDPDEDGLQKAIGMWPAVDQAIRTNAPPPPQSPR